jgi:hypothetical protein
VSKVEIAKIEMRASANGTRNAERTPVTVNGNGPSSFKQAQPASDFTSWGTASAAQTMDSSSAVRLTEKKPPLVPQVGTSASAAKRQIANWPGIRENRRFIDTWRRILQPQLVRLSLSSALPSPAGALNPASAPATCPPSSAMESPCIPAPPHRSLPAPVHE